MFNLSETVATLFMNKLLSSDLKIFSGLTKFDKIESLRILEELKSARPPLEELTSSDALTIIKDLRKSNDLEIANLSKLTWETWKKYFEDIEKTNVEENIEVPKRKTTVSQPKQDVSSHVPRKAISGSVPLPSLSSSSRAATDPIQSKSTVETISHTPDVHFDSAVTNTPVVIIQREEFSPSRFIYIVDSYASFQ